MIAAYAVAGLKFTAEDLRRSDGAIIQHSLATIKYMQRTLHMGFKWLEVHERTVSGAERGDWQRSNK